MSWIWLTAATFAASIELLVVILSVILLDSHLVEDDKKQVILTLVLVSLVSLLWPVLTTAGNNL
jgi:hypothetical protein